MNEGFSGGEKKRNEILQMLVLEPRLAVLDETDSGLDIDALKVVAGGVNIAALRPERAFVLVTHYQRLLEYVVPGPRARAGARAHRAQRRHGPRARTGAARLRLGRGRGRLKAAAMNALTTRIAEDFARAAPPRGSATHERRRAALAALTRAGPAHLAR